MVAAVVLGALLAIAGYSIVTHNGSSSPAQGTRTLPRVPATSPSSTPSTTPQSPSSGSIPGGALPTPTAPNGNGSSRGNGSSSGNSNGRANSTQSVGVVDINTRLAYQQAEAAGTGIVVTSSGEVMTNNHVIDGATSISVTVVSTGKTYSATVVGTDPTDDVALLQLKDASGLQTANLGTSSGVKVGDSVTAVGNAGGTGGTPSASPGTVTALNQSITATDMDGSNAERLTNLIQIDASLQPGDSGGPLYNASGQVVGMNAAASGGRRRFQTSGTQGYAIPIDKALGIVKQIESGKASDTITIGTPGFLGVEVTGNDQNGSPSAAGAVVSQVLSGTPAQQIGLQAGDIITAVGGQQVVSADDLGTLLHVHHAGDKVQITWTGGDGSTHTGTATLAAGPAD
jgi:S1-C subfamily serine protease